MKKKSAPADSKMHEDTVLQLNAHDYKGLYAALLYRFWLSCKGCCRFREGGASGNKYVAL